MSFQGFGPEALPFFKALAFHQSREWFEANRATYESAVKGPMGDFVEDVAERLSQSENPDQGRPQILGVPHPSRRALFQEQGPLQDQRRRRADPVGRKGDPGVLYFHLSPEECFFAAGFHLPDPAELGRLRAAAARAPKAFKAMTAKLAKARPRACRTRIRSSAPPRGFEAIDDPEIAAAIRLKSLICLQPVTASCDRARRRWPTTSAPSRAMRCRCSHGAGTRSPIRAELIRTRSDAASVAPREVTACLTPAPDL